MIRSRPSSISSLGRLFRAATTITNANANANTTTTTTPPTSTSLTSAPHSIRSYSAITTTTKSGAPTATPAHPTLSAGSGAATAAASDAFQLLPEPFKAGPAEDALYEAQTAEVESWWRAPRWDGIRRPYTSTDVVSKRGTQRISYPSSVMAQKLWRLIREREAEGKPIHTMGAIDPVQMTQQAPNQEVLYVSGWACSSLLVSTNEVSADFGDYPYNTVPNQVHRLAKAQSMHDRRQWDARRAMTAAARASVPYVDYLRPIVADGDTGHGGLTSVMKLAKLFAESGAAAVHFEDQLHGGKKCGHLAGKVLVPVGEHLGRLAAARFQWDVMGCENLVIARTDAESGRLLSSTVDARDHEFVLGVADPAVEPLAEVLQEMEARGASGHDLDAFEAVWVEKTRLLTFDEAAVEHMERGGTARHKIAAYTAEVAAHPDMPVSRRRRLADSLASSSSSSPSPVYFSWDVPRTREGYYHYRGGMPAATKRALAFGPYADLLWVETGGPDVGVAARLARTVREAYPHKALVYNLSPSFNWMAHGFTDATLRSFVWDIAKEGFVLQLVSLAGLHSNAAATTTLSRAFKEDGMLAYVNLVQRPEREMGCEVLTHQTWSGAAYVDGMVGAVRGGNSSSRSMGEGSTEGQF